MELCNTPHPEHPDILCDKASPCFGYHGNAPRGVTWDGNPLPAPQVTRGKRSELKAHIAQIIDRAR